MINIDKFNFSQYSTLNINDIISASIKLDKAFIYLMALI